MTGYFTGLVTVYGSADGMYMWGYVDMWFDVCIQTDMGVISVYTWVVFDCGTLVGIFDG